MLPCPSHVANNLPCLAKFDFGKYITLQAVPSFELWNISYIDPSLFFFDSTLTRQ
jgi:hypothetical protein